jgi:hypothetical protein
VDFEIIGDITNIEIIAIKTGMPKSIGTKLTASAKKSLSSSYRF